MVRVKEQRGSLLVEVILTVVILTGGLTLIIQSMAATVRAMASIEDYSAAIMLLDKRLFQYVTHDVEGSFRDHGELSYLGKPYVYTIETRSGPDGRWFTELNAEIAWGPEQKKKLTLSTYLLHPLNET